MLFQQPPQRPALLAGLRGGGGDIAAGLMHQRGQKTPLERVHRPRFGRGEGLDLAGLRRKLGEFMGESYRKTYLSCC